MDKTEMSRTLLEAKKRKGVTWAELAKKSRAKFLPYKKW